MTYRIRGLSQATFAHLFDLDEGALEAHHAAPGCFAAKVERS